MIEPNRRCDETRMQNPRFAASRIMLGTFILVALIGCDDVQAAAASIWPTRRWQTSTPEEQGMDSAALAKLVQFGTTRSFDSLLIARHGRIVLDAYYAPYAAGIPHAINSDTKAVIGTLAAIACKDGLLDSPNHRMLDFFGDRSVANVDDKKRAITVQSLLDMTSGIDWKEGIGGRRPDTLIEYGRSPDLIKFVLDRPMSNAPGDVFNYNSGNPHLLSAIITKLTGMSALDYAKARLFGPLGIDISNWRHDHQGFSIGGGGLALLPRDMAKIGYLYLHNGEWEDKPLLLPAWVDRVSHASVNMNASFESDLRYANFFWALPTRQVYMAVGDHCQLIMVFPKLDMVAVTTARNYCPFGKLADFISGAVKSETALSPDPAAANRLAAAIGDIATEKPTAVGATPQAASVISGNTYNFPSNAVNVKALSVTITDPHPHCDLEMYTGDRAQPSLRLSGPIGLDGLYRKREPTVVGVMAAKGTWLDDQTFAIDLLAPGVDEQYTWILSFDGESANLRSKDRSGREVSIDGEAAGSH
jgi:CubicO group peptidase (beta-lactamase class C family)